MDCYWRLKNIPELRGVPEKDRRREWREVASRSHTARGALAVFLLFGLCVVSGDLIASRLGHATDWIHWGCTLSSVVLAAVVNEYALVQPRARRWLREHAGERDRYTWP